ncbi:MAG: Pr6Pr family membrane protein [Microcella sp.]|uniref:Pr6Pr family membrane protein n=1 Tax=Microcella sp. TaxID=1913979 RepID=UPI00272079DB|nr:Pr6Pr family membrane protein [Microcella sp.]MDO8336867.1 Pr6Pr family membrane protein [Microcella sp.]
MSERATARRVVGALRLLAALVGVLALVARFQYGLGFSVFIASNFFGYLTVQSNIAAIALGIVSGAIALRRSRDPVWMPVARVAILSWMLVAGLVFALLASQAATRGYRLDVPFSDQLLHFVLPAWLLIDWLLSPGERRTDPRVLLIVVGYPLGWGLVTLVRGAIVGWYPYFFLDPDQVSGTVELLAYGAAALGLFALVGAVVRVLPRIPLDRMPALSRPTARARRRDERAPRAPR